MISESWFGEFLYSSNAYKTAQATGIQIFGNDHYVTNTIVFSSKIGVHVTNPANVMTGVHTWNLNAGDGGIGFLVESTQNRLLACYFDGNDVIVKVCVYASRGARAGNDGCVSRLRLRRCRLRTDSF